MNWHKWLVFIPVFLLAISAIAQTDSLIPVKRGKKFGYHNQKGENVIDYVYQYAGEFINGLALVQYKNKWGFIDAQNKATIDLEYDSAFVFAENRAAVKKNNLWGYVNEKGENVIDFQFSKASSFHNGLAIVAIDSLFGFINTSGKIVIELKYKNLMPFSEKRAGAKKQTGWGFIGIDRMEYTHFEYDSVGFYFDSIAPVKKGDKWGYVDYKGLLITDFVYLTLKNRNEDYNLAWFYADFAAQNARGGKKDTLIPIYKAHLQKAIDLLEFDSDYFALSELKKMKSYYRCLGNKQKKKEYRRRISQKRNEEEVNIYNRPKVTMDLSVATEPLAVDIDFNDWKKLPPLPPLYAEWRIGIVGIGARYKIYDNYVDKLRFGAWRTIPNWPQNEAWNTYDASEYSAFLKFYNRENIKKAIYGYGHAGQYYGFEYRRNFHKFQPFSSEIIATDGSSFTALVQPKIRSHDLSIVIGFSRSKGIFFFDVGLGLGYGRREIKLPYNRDVYRYSNERVGNDRLFPFYFPVRLNLKIGINIL